jgi:glycosyltransferase involved in cell wall biosynthesis
MNPKTIVYVHGSANMYGASRSLLRLVTNLKKPYTPLVVLPESGPLQKSLQDANIEVVILPWLQKNILGRQAFHGTNLIIFFATFLPNIWRFSRFLRGCKASLVHTNNSTVIVPACSAALARIPHFWHIRETLDEYVKLWDRFATTETSFIWKTSSYLALRFWSLYVRFIYALSLKVICVSNVVCQPFKELELNEKTQVVYNGLEISYYTDPSIEPLSLSSWVQEPDRYLYVGTVGEIRAGKGQLFLINSFAQFKKKYPEAKVKCLLIGGYEQKNLDYYHQIETIIKENNLEEDVIIYGQIPDPRPGFARLDIFVLPSIQAEPFGTVVLEAMVSKIPIIGTAIGGTLEQIEDGKSGILIKPEDTPGLASAIEVLVFDPKKRLLMAENEFARVIANFNVESYIANIQQMYDSSLNDDCKQGSII